MPTPDRVQLVAEVSAVTVLVRGVLEWMFPDESLEALYAQAPRSWTRTLASIMHLKITIEIDERQAGIVEKDLSGTAEQIEELILEAIQRTGRVALETALQQVEAACSIPACCGRRMESRGQRTLTLISTFGPLKGSRRRYRCSHCGEETYSMDTNGVVVGI